MLPRAESNSPRHRSILITGASSGIGRALARIYAGPGVKLSLIGRNTQRLDDIAQVCRSSGADVTAAAIDVRARNELSDWIRAADDRNPLDLAITCAGISTGTGLGRPRENPDCARAVIETNLVGAINTADPVVERMCMRGRGQIAFVGSIGGLRGLPYSPSYSATKAAIHVYAEALRGNLAATGVRVSLVVPGFVDTHLNYGLISPRPLQVSDEKAAQIIRRGLERQAAVIAFPKLLYYGAHLSRLLPRRWVDMVFASCHVDVPENRDRAE